MTMDRISAAVSALGIVAGTLVLLVAFDQYRAGGSAGWVALGAAVLLASLYTLVRDVRRLRRHSA
ncbi:hypothetical protein [Streptomyces fradiae]|uniref:hypothetical protein n=1 Tax=Streptomyces fradiae TaxID=1906 RepID=UPI002942F2A2|nr:hypothetical protein [Streptomyces fradiae]WOI62311.1 hypothetical protein RYQ63_21785 [Streptomyces fradiae]